MNKMSQDSRMNITGKNALIAALTALILTIILTFVYSCAALFLNFSTREDFNVSTALDYLEQSFTAFFKFIGICVVPVIFIFSFAMLQRFRIKENPNTNGAEEGI